MQQFIGVKDVPTTVTELLDRCLATKASPKPYRYAGESKTITCLFFSHSLRTRLSTDKAARNVSMHVVTMDVGDTLDIELEDGSIMDLDTVEHVKEVAGVISQYTDIIAVRTFPGFESKDADYQDEVINAFVKYSTVPVISLESAIRHPLQSLADCMTIKEQSSRPRPKVVLTWAPHPKKMSQSIANSFAEWMQAWGEVELVIANPPGMDLSPEFTGDAQVIHDQSKAFIGADFIYAKNWSSYQDYGKILTNAPDWLITRKDMDLTNNGKFMHCLPVRRNVVVSDEVLDCDQSLVMEQAANRTWATQTVLLEILNGMSK